MRFVWSLGFMPIQKQSVWYHFKRFIPTRLFLENTSKLNEPFKNEKIN